MSVRVDPLILYSTLIELKLKYSLQPLRQLHLTIFNRRTFPSDFDHQGPSLPCTLNLCRPVATATQQRPQQVSCKLTIQVSSGQSFKLGKVEGF